MHSDSAISLQETKYDFDSYSYFVLPSGFTKLQILKFPTHNKSTCLKCFLRVSNPFLAVLQQQSSPKLHR